MKREGYHFIRRDCQIITSTQHNSDIRHGVCMVNTTSAKSKPKQERASISVSKKTRARLTTRWEAYDDTFDKVINRLLDHVEACENSNA